MKRSPGLHSSVTERIKWAGTCFRGFGDRLRENRKISDLLDELMEAIHASRREMESCGMAEVCRVCDKDRGGSCCGAGLEDKYDPLLLLINRLLGQTLPRSRYDERGCLFLGPQGCQLMARHVICVNYVCKEISESIPPDKLKVLREKEGHELNLLFRLHETLSATIRAF